MTVKNGDRRTDTDNHGFILHGDAGNWFPRAHSREAKEVKDRPAVWVIYEPGK